MKRLTVKQKNKCKKIIELLKDLAKEDITMVVESSPNLELAFVRELSDMDLEEYLDTVVNVSDGKRYQPESSHKNFKLEIYAF